MRRRWWIVIVFVILGGAWLVLRGRSGVRETRFDPKAAALARFEEVQGEGTDLSSGPCLGVIGPDWVADVAHDPRQPEDDEPTNQCPEFRSGAATHFVELTPDGTVIRVR